ncbi:MAG: UDP-glycosyltransferase [Bacteroidota bacterium]
MYDRIKILIVTDNIDVNDGSGAKANVAIIQNLSSSGFDITVCHHTGYKHELKGIRTELVRIKKVNIFYLIYILTRWVNRYFKYNLNRVIEKYTGFPAEFFNTAKSIRSHIRKKHDVSRFDMVITLSKGTSFRPHYALLGMPEWHTKWMAYIHDPYPYHLYPRPYRFRPIGYKQKERFFLKMSEAARWVAFPSKLLMQWMAYDFPAMLQKGVVIPHQIADTSAEPPTAYPFINPEMFTLAHAGLLMSARQPFGLIKGYLKFLEKHPDAAEKSELILAGKSDFSEHELRKASKNTPSVKYILRTIPYHEASAIQNQTTVNIIIESDYYVSPFLPGKFPHCVAADKPILILSPYYSETRRLVGNDYPYWSEGQNANRIADILSDLYVNWKATRNLKLPDSHSLKAYLSKEKLSEQIHRLLEPIHE